MIRPRTWILGIALAVPVWSCGGGGGGGPTEPEVPAITSIDVSEIRAGEVLVIRGRNLSAAVVPTTGTLTPAQTTVEVLVDGRVLTPESVTNTEIRVRIPLDLAPGSHTLTVRVNGKTSNSIPFTVEVFTVTGVYEGDGRIASATCNDPVVQAELRQIFPPGATGVGIMAALDQRPALALASQNFTEEAILEAIGTLEEDGTFHTTVQDTDPEIVSEISGRFTAAGSEVRVQAVNTITLDVTLDNGFRLICEVELEFDERRVSTTLSTSGPVPAAGPSIVEELRGLANRAR